MLDTMRIIYYSLIPALEAVLISKYITFRNILLGLFLTLGLIWLGIWLFYILHNIGQPQIEFGEGVTIYNAKLFASGNWVWDMSGPPYMTSFYTPIAYWIYGKMFELPVNPYILARIFQLLLTGGCMAFVFFIVRYFTKDNIISLIATLLPTSQLMIFRWVLFVRIDLLAIFFELAGLYIFLKLQKSRWVFFSIIIFAIAFYSKQSMICGAGAAIIYLFLQNRKRGLIFAGAYCLVIGGIMVIGSLLTGGYFFKQTILFQRTVPAFNSFHSVFGLELMFIVTFIPVLFMGLSYTFKNIKNLFSLYAILTLITCFLLLFKPGGTYNYFLQSLFALSITAGIFISELIKGKYRFYKAVTGVFFLIYLALVISGIIPFSSIGNMPDYKDPSYTAQYSKAEAIISDANYPILTDNFGIVVDAGKTPYLNDPRVFMDLNQLGYWNDSSLLSDLKNNRIEYVITTEDMGYLTRYNSCPEWKDAIIENYHIVLDDSHYVNGFVIYKANNKN
jgi:hypothetical protein